MAIQNLLKALNQRVGRGLTEIGGFNPMQQVSPEEARMRRQAGIENLQRSLGRSAAILSGDPQRLALAEEQMRQAEQKRARRQFVLENPQYADMIKLQELGIDTRLLGKQDSELFKGQGVANQFYNVLLQGQQDESVRQSPMYKTAYDYLSQPKTETYINEVGQQVTRKIPGMISKEDYLPPAGVAAVDEKPVVTEPKQEEIVKVSPERRKILQTQIDTVNNSERKILAFQAKLDEMQPGPLTVGEDRADIESQYTAVLLELKNLEELGVLAGPDLDLLQSMLGDPLSLKQFFIKGGTEGVKKQLNNLLQSIRDRKTPIYKELGMKEPEGTITQTRKKYYMPNGREIKVNATGDGWVYADTGEAVQQ